MAGENEIFRIDSERLRATLDASSVIGRFETGLKRLALSDEDKQMRDLFVSWGRKAGFDV